MKFKSLLLSMSVMASLPAFAATYYVTPDGAGTKDGSSWENALGTEEFRAQALKNENGDTYELAAGTYKPTACIIFLKGTYAIVNGSEDGRTILSGDINDDGTASEGDLSQLIRFSTTTGAGNYTRPVEINNVEFTSVYTDITADDTNDSANTGVNGVGALFVDNSGMVTLNNCKFYGNSAMGTLGGAPVNLNRSKVTFNKCEFFNNYAKTKGSAVRLRDTNGGKGITTFDGCVFKNNTNENMGVVFLNHGKELNFINCMIAGNTSTSTDRAAAVFAVQKGAHQNQVTVINSTIAGNTVSQIGFNGADANLRVVNSIVAGNSGSSAIEFANGETFGDVKSGGYNYVGPIDAGEFWQTTDTHGTDYNYASVFGTNSINDNNIIIPVNYIAGASGEQIENATADWGLPAELKLTVDASGKTRTAGMSPGAYAYTQTDVEGFHTGIDSTIDNAANSLRIVKVGYGVYSIKGATEGITAYSITGVQVAAGENDTIDLSAFAPGIYIIKTGNDIFKVIK